MCTYIIEQAEVAGSGKGAAGWFSLSHANVSYDHPFHADYEHALNIDFVNESQGIGARVAVELTAESARALVRAIEAALGAGEKAEAEFKAEAAQRAESQRLAALASA